MSGLVLCRDTGVPLRWRGRRTTTNRCSEVRRFEGAMQTPVRSGVDVERVFVVCWASSERMFDERPF